MQRGWLGIVAVALGVAAGACGDNAAPASRVRLSGNWGYTCRIDDAGALSCWSALSGSAGFGGIGGVLASPTVIGDGRWRTVAAGTDHACAIAEAGTLWCWGQNRVGELGDGTHDNHLEPVQVGTADDWIAIAVGGGRSCGLRGGGALWCWGGDVFGDPAMAAIEPVPIAGRWRSVSSHWYEACAIRDDDTLWCWHDAQAGASAFDPPAQVGESRWRSIAVGVLGVVGVRDDGSLWSGSIADGVMTPIGVDTDWSDAVAAAYHACAIKVDGSLWCWGRNDTGQLGNGAKSDDVADPVRVGTESDWIAVAAAAGHSCGLRADGGVWCWGSNAVGELGIGDFPYRPSPARVGTGTGWTATTVGFQFSCGLRGDVLSCWGYNGWGQLGIGSEEDQLAPTEVAGRFTAVEAGAFYACGTAPAGALSCWGQDMVTSPSVALPGIPAVGLSTGEGGTCAISDSGALWCWPTEYQPGILPMVIGTGTWRSVAASYNHRCAIDVGGGLYCWGQNSEGELGLGDVAPRADPTRVGTGSWLAVAAGNGGNGGYTCAITDDGGHGRLFCWGDGSGGRRGTGGDDASVSSPQQVGTDATWVTLSLAISHGCAIRSDGSLWCWGRNLDGSLGIGASDDQIHPPTRVGDATWSDVAAGENHTCATSTDGSLWCWGTGGSGELGDGSAWRLEPVMTVR